MLTTREDISPKEQYYADSLLTKPTTAHSVFSNLAMGVATPIIALNALDSDFSKKPEGRAIMSAYDSVRLENQTPGATGVGHWLSTEGANMIGFGLNPITWGLGEAGALAVRGAGAVGARLAPDVLSTFMRRPIAEMVTKPIGQYIPQMYGRGIGETPLSLGLVSKKTAETFGIFAGAGVPQAIVDNFNRDTNHINWGGVAREAGEMGAFGIALGALPFTWGVLRGKINRARGTELSEAIDHSALDKALEDGHITADEHAWYKDYLEHQKNPHDEAMMSSLQERGSVIANKNGHTANTVSNEALFEILTPNDVNNLHGAISDQISGGVPEAYQKSLSDFIIHNRMDYVRQNPKWLDGVRGYVDFINQKLIAKPSKIAEADRILDEHMLKGVKENMPFSQKEMFKRIQQTGFEHLHLKQLPITIPQNVIDRLKNYKKYYRGTRINPEISKGVEPNFDYHFGKGYWFAEIKEHAKHYGKYIEKIEGDYKLYDTIKGEDKYANKLLKTITNLSFTARPNIRYGKLRNAFTVAMRKRKRSNTATKLHKYLQSKGYQGLKRLEGAADSFGARTPVKGFKGAKTEIMFFEKPKHQPLPELLSPKEELMQLRQILLGEGGLPPKWELSDAYHRLVDLSHVWHNARSLLDRVHLEHEYNRQTAFKDLAHQVLRIADNDMPRVAKPENVVDYLKRRIEGTLNKAQPVSEIEAVAKAKRDVPTDADAILSEQTQDIAHIDAETMKQEYEMSTERFKEFKSSENIFKNLIGCVLGGLNA